MVPSHPFVKKTVAFLWPLDSVFSPQKLNVERFSRISHTPAILVSKPRSWIGTAWELAIEFEVTENVAFRTFF